MHCRGRASPRLDVNTLPKSCLAPPDTVSGPIAIHCPPPCRGREEAAERPGGGGVPAKTVQRETHETREGDVPSPSPSAPPPRGDIPSMHCRGRASPRLDVNTLPKSCLAPPDTVSGPIAIHCPPPCRGREEAAERPGGGGVPAKTVQRETHETGEGDVPSPSPSAPPPRGNSPWIQSPGNLAVSSRSHLTPPKDPASAPDTVSGPIAIHCPPPSRGREEAAERAGRWGCSSENRSTAKTGDRGGGCSTPPPRQPHTRGAISHGYSPRGSGSLFAASPDTPPKDPAPAPCTATGPIARHSPAPWERRLW